MRAYNIINVSSFKSSDRTLFPFFETIKYSAYCMTCGLGIQMACDLPCLAKLLFAYVMQDARTSAKTSWPVKRRVSLCRRDQCFICVCQKEFTHFGLLSISNSAHFRCHYTQSKGTFLAYIESFRLDFLKTSKCLKLMIRLEVSAQR